MKKIILFVTAMALISLGFTSCEKTSAGKTGVVDYVKLQLLGPSSIQLALGDTYEEPGWTATDKGKDVHDKVNVTIVNMLGEVVDAVTTDIPGIFTLTYSATSEDKMYIEAERQVMVFDATLTASLDGAFAVDYDKSDYNGGTWNQWYAVFSDPEKNGDFAAYAQKAIDVNFKEIVPGIYNVDDLLGGFYGKLRGLGLYYGTELNPVYLTYFDMKGMVILNADLSLTLVSSHLDNWDDSLEGFTGTFDAETGTLDMHCIYNEGQDWHIVMVKK